MEIVRKSFKSDWTQSTFFVEVKHGAFCLLCPPNQKLLASYRKFSLKRHFESHHPSVYKESSESRKILIENLLANLNTQYSNEIKTYIETKQNKSEDERKVKIASFIVAHKIISNSKPFEEGNFIKECLDSVICVLCPELKEKLCGISLSRRSIGRKIVKINNYLIDKLKSLIADAKCYSICVDESTDVKDVAQLCIFIRGINKRFEIFEELLQILPMRDRTTGKDIFEQFMKCKEEFGIQLFRLVSATTDGCPSMTGKKVGFVSLLAEEIKKEQQAPEFHAFHCIIHQEVLCKNALKIDNVTRVATNLVNYVRASSLRHRQFREFLKEKQAQYDDIPQHHQIRWLSISETVSRVYSLKDAVVEYLKKIKNNDFPQFESCGWLNDCAFSVDILHFLNKLNKKLQGKNQFAFEMYRCVDKSVIKMREWSVQLKFGDIENGDFPNLFARKNNISQEEFDKYSDVVGDLTNNFLCRFNDFRKFEILLKCTHDLFNVDLNTDIDISSFPWKKYSVAAIEEYKKIRNDPKLNENNKKMDCVEFFNSLEGFEFRHVKFLACCCFTLFGSTYDCESLFSRMNINKSAIRSNLNDASLDAILRICSTKIQINFEELALKE